MASKDEKLIREKKMPKMEDVKILIEGTQTLLRERQFNVSRQEKAKKDAVEEIRTTSWKRMIEARTPRLLVYHWTLVWRSGSENKTSTTRGP